ncbi:hypothetical protein N2W54_003178 [Lotmaria passim]
MAFNLSTVMAYMCGAEVPELQLSFFESDGVVDVDWSDATSEAMSSTTSMLGDVKKSSEGRCSTSAVANTNKPLSSVVWMWRTRQEYVRSVLSKKDKIVALPSVSPSKNNHSPFRASYPQHHPQEHNSGSLPTNGTPSTGLMSRSETMPLTRVVAQTLSCLGCTPLTASTSPEKLQWGVPRWPTCTITLGAPRKAEKPGETFVIGVEASRSDADKDTSGDVAGERVTLSWTVEESPLRSAMDPNVAAVMAAAAAATTTTTTEAAMTAPSYDFEGQADEGQSGSEASSRLVVRLRDAYLHTTSTTTTTTPCSAFDEDGVAVFCDPVRLPSSSPLPSRVQPPPSLLLPDLVCLRSVPAPRLSTSSASFLSTSSTATTSDGPTVEVVLVAVESLPELYETRRQGLMLYKEVLLRHYATKVDAALAMRNGEADDVFSASGPFELPSLRWRCELWTPAAEGRAAPVSADSAAAAAATATGTITSAEERAVCRTLVQGGLFSMYTRNKCAVTPRVGASLDTGLTTLAPTAPLLVPRFMDNDEVWTHATRVPSPMLRAALDELDTHLCVFCRWWCHMEELTRRLVLSAAPPLSMASPQGDSAAAAADVASSPTTTTTICNSSVHRIGSAVDGVMQDVKWMRGTVEQLLLWWAAKSVRQVSSVSPRSPSAPLPPLPSNAAPLFGAIVIPPHVRPSPPPPLPPPPPYLLSPTRSGSSSGAQSPPAMSLPSLTLCFVNPRGAYVHEYDKEALNVLCRAVHTLRASVCVFDAAQKAALLAWMKSVVRPYTAPPSPADAATATTPTTTRLPYSSAGAATATATASSAALAATSADYLEFPYDAFAEVERSCLCLEDYVFERHRRALADEDDDAEAHDMAEKKGAGKVSDSAVQKPPPSRWCSITEKARTGAVPTWTWCHDARVLACSDFFGRRRLDVFTSPIKRTTPSNRPLAAAQRQQPPQSPPSPLVLNAIPPSFLSYVLTRIGDNGVEEVEPLSGTLMQMGRRLSGG